MSSYGSQTDRTDTATELATAAKLCIIRSLLEKIEALGGPLVDDALECCRERVKRDGWRIERGRAMHLDPHASTIANLVGTSRELVDAVFAPSKADLVIEVLREFLAASWAARPKAGRR